MKCKFTLENVIPTLAVAGLMILTVPTVSHAVPYASTVSQSGGTVNFRLNESADNVKVVFSGPTSTLDLGALSKGSHSFARGGAASYAIQVTKSAPPIWTQISADTDVLMQYYGPISLSINRNPASTNFGRIYILDDGGQGSTAGGTRLTTEGIFVLNPDITDAFGQGDTGLQAGLSALNIWTGTGGSDRYDPFQIEVGEDDYVYITDANDPRGGLLRALPDLSSGEQVLAGIGNTTEPTIHTVLYGLHTRGSLTGGNLTIWATDGQWQGGTLANAVLRYDIGGTTLPFSTAPTQVATPGPDDSERDSDLSVAADGNIFVSVSLDGGTGATGVPGVQVFSPAGALLWSSVIGGTDVFTNAYSLEVSPDNSKLAIIRRDRQTWIVGLTNGANGRIPDLSTTNLVATFSVGSGNGRSINWDLAGNLYVGNPSTERVRIFSPGGTTTATTTSSGTFGITVPANTVAISNSVASISENNSTPIVFTVNRAGNTASTLFASFLFTGTASNGVDHAAFPTNITFPAGVTTTNISIIVSNDNLAEFTETLIVSVNSGTNYSVGTPASATTAILDDETPEISVALAQVESRLLEGFDGSRVGFQLTRKGLLTPALSVNIAYSGAASQGADFTPISSVAIGANEVNALLSVAPVNDPNYEGSETLIVTPAAGAGYVVQPANSATATIIDDDAPPGGVLFADNFETNSATRWIVNSADAGADSAADFAYDYSQLYVPPAPNGSSTLGLRFRLNESSGALNAVSASPLNLNLGGDFRLKFNMWINYNGPMFDGGSGSTMHFTAGVGTTADHANLATSGVSDGIWFGMSGDGGSTMAVGDCDAYAATSLFNDNSTVYAAGTGPANGGIRKTTHPYYALWGNIPAPADQLLNYPTQTGTSGPGNMGVSWHTVVITKTGNAVTWIIDGILLATVPADSTTLSTNVFVGFQDLFPGVSGDTAMSFVLVDNLRVETLVATMTISSIQLINNGTQVQIDFTAGAGDTIGSFTLQSSGTVNGIYGDVSATFSQLGSGSFRAVRPAGGSPQFYRLRR